MALEVKLAYYRQSDWEKLLRSVADRNAMHDTWEEWHQEYRRIKKEIKAQGFVVHEMTNDIDALNVYCLERGLKNDGRTRSQYTSQLPLTRKKK